MAKPKPIEPPKTEAVNEAGSNGIQPCSDAGLEVFLSGLSSETDRNNAIVALGHFLQGQPSGYSAHLISALLAHAHLLNSTSERIEKAIASGSPDAIAKALAAVEKTAREQATAVERYPRWTFALNTSIQAITAVLGAIIGAGIIGALWYVNHDALAKTDEYRLAQDLKTIHGQIDYSTSVHGRMMTIKVLNPQRLNPGQPAWSMLPPYVDNQGNTSITLVAPAPER